ncbi:hypothetical protein [Paenibacillus riograndensis]|nr:hypothetical protein [Paenibacillus riograndensis]
MIRHAAASGSATIAALYSAAAYGDQAWGNRLHWPIYFCKTGNGGVVMITYDDELLETCRKLLKRSAWRIQYKTRIQLIRESSPLYDNQLYDSGSDSSFETMVISELFVDELLETIPWEKCRYIIKKTVIEGMAEHEVARELHMTQQGVSKWKRKGLEILKEYLIISSKQ